MKLTNEEKSEYAILKESGKALTRLNNKNL